MGNNENLSVATKQAVYQLHSSYSIPTKGFTVTSVCVFRSWMGWVGNATALYILNVGVYDKAWVCEFLFLSIVSVIKMYSLNCRTVLLQDHSFLIIRSELLCSSKMHIDTYFLNDQGLKLWYHDMLLHTFSMRQNVSTSTNFKSLVSPWINPNVKT